MLWVKFVYSQNLYVEVLVPLNVTLFGNIVTAEVISYVKMKSY